MEFVKTPVIAAAFWASTLSLAALAFLAPRSASPLAQHGNTACLSNVKQLTLGVHLYAADNDDHAPTASRWRDSVDGYLKTGSQKILYRCSLVGEGEGYAFSQKRSQATLGTIPLPAQTALVLESTDLRRNAVGGAELLPRPGRHTPSGRRSGNNFGRADGSAAFHPDGSIPTF